MPSLSRPLTFFTSDTHFFHKNIIRPDYCDRPFKTPDGEPDLDAMHRALIDHWNYRVSDNDTVYHLGDFAFGKPNRWADILRKLKGRRILVRGNHDRSAATMRSVGFDEVVEEAYIICTDLGPPVRLYLAHHPTPVSVWGEKADYHFCGHVHEAWATKNTSVSGKMINVGVDVRDMKPQTAWQLLKDFHTRHPEATPVVAFHMVGGHLSVT